MENQHSDPKLSMISGAIFGFGAFISEHGWVIENIIQLIKVISFGIIGGACGYIGKFLAQKIHKFLN